MVVHLLTGKQPGSVLQPVLGRSKVTGAFGISGSGSRASPGGSGLLAGGRGPRWGVRREFARYAVVGGFAFICDASTLFSLTRFLGVNYLVSAPIGFVFGTVVNYVLCRRWVFQHRTLKSTPAEMTVFTLIGAVGLGLNEEILWFFQSKLGIYYLFAKGVSGVVVFGWNFGARKLALFR